MYIQNSVNLSIIAVLVMVLSPILSHRYSAVCRYYLWLIVIAAFLIPFRLQLYIPRAIQLILPDGAKKIFSYAKVNGIPAYAGTVLNWHILAVVLWITGILSIWSWYIFHHLRFLSAVKRWSEKVSMDRMIYFQEVKNEMNVERRIEIFCCACIRTPMMIGFVNPIILIPNIDLTKDEFSLIIRHELIHYRRKDLFLKILSMLALTIHWFNPVVYFIVRHIQNLCEISCDEEVLKGSDSKIRADYGKMIIEVIRKGQFYQTAISASFCDRVDNIKKRIYAIMDTKIKHFSFLILIVTVVIVFLGISEFILPAKKEKIPFSRQMAASPVLNSSIKSDNASEAPGSAENHYINEQIKSIKSPDNDIYEDEIIPHLVAAQKSVSDTDRIYMTHEKH